MIGHYIPKMKEDWAKFSKKIKGKEYNDHDRAMEESCFMVEKLLSSGVCWSISKAAFPLVWNTDLSEEVLENTKLPYPTVLIEYNYDYECLGLDKSLIDKYAVPSEQRIIIMHEVSEEHFVMISAYKVSPSDFENEELAPPTEWIMSPMALLIKYEALNHLSDWFSEDKVKKEFLFAADPKMGVEIKTALPMYKEVLKEVDKKNYEGLMKELVEEAKVALGLLSILSCNNAPVEEITPPEKINKKRKKTGRPQIPTYRTLHISDHTSRPSTGASGTHASPRAHWRRGHIRNQPTARGYVRKWIKPTIVAADKGEPKKPEVVLT